MEKKHLYLGASIFIIFLAGLFYLAHLDKTTPTGSDARFLSYAESLGLDLTQFKTDLLSEDVAATVNADLAEGNAKNITSTPTFYANGAPLKFTTSLTQNQAIIDEIIAKDETPEVPSGHRKGAENPKVMIVKYSDFECPACGTMSAPMKELVEANPETVAYIYKHFPLPMHQHALSAAKAAEAAAKQGKFWEMHDLLFEERREWSR